MKKMHHKEKFTYSIIVPVYNESRRLHNLTQIIDFLKKSSFKSELIVVNDGSKDDTLAKLREMKNKYNFRVIGYKTNKGKGYAVKVGMLKATGDYRLFCDADLSTPMKEINSFIPFLKKYDVVIGTRKTGKANVVVEQPMIRKWLGKGFTFLSQIILNVWISDFTCGFKMFSAEAAKKIFGNVAVYRWGFDSEIMYLTKKYGFSIKEIPVTWINDLNSKVKFPQDLIVSLKELIAVRLNDWLYKKY